MGREKISIAERIQRLEAQVAALSEENVALRKENAELREEVERLRNDDRNNKGSAAPFARKKRKQKPKRPGRKPGEGEFNFRRMPTPNRPEVAVPAPGACPHCHAAGTDVLQPVRAEVVTVTKLPPREPIVTPYRVEVCECRACGRTVRGEHPDLAPDQSGATAHRIDAEVYALAHTLHYGVGVPVRKLPEVLAATCGIEITQSAITQHALKQAAPDGPVGAVADELREQVTADAIVVHTDDTSWRVTHEPQPEAWLMVFETAGDPARDPQIVVFQIRPRHRSDEVMELIPPDWPGTLVTDRGPSYDADALRAVAQQKCLAHIARNLADARARQHPGARSFTLALERAFRSARELWSAWHAGELDESAFRARAGPLKEELSRLLADRELRDADNQRLLDGLGWHDDRDSLLRFLDDPWIEPTNNRAERALRPAVIARKVSQCSKTRAGAAAHAAFTTVLATLKRRLLDPVATIAGLLHGTPIPAPTR